MCVSKLDEGLGFKDFESFNLAMLAKQWWRIIHSPQSLSFKVLRGRYFYYDDPMKIPQSLKGSYLWTSLMEGRKVIEEGAYWRVGDGQRIDVWKDAWIKQLPSFKVIQPEDTIPTPMKVAALID